MVLAARLAFAELLCEAGYTGGVAKQSQRTNKQYEVVS